MTDQESSVPGSGPEVADGAEGTADAGPSASARFREEYGRAPEGVWAAPGRANLIGEHTDYNGGFVMPLALPHTCRVAAARRADGALRVRSADEPGGTAAYRPDELAPGRADAGWSAYPAGVLWALRRTGADVGGADLYFSSAVPVGAGLSSSAALELATAVALNDLYGLGLGAEQLARLCQLAENEFVGVPCGIMDQMASASCTAGHALHLDTRELSQRHVPFDVTAHGLRLLVVDTRVKHSVGDGEYASRREGCERGAAALGVPQLRDVPHRELETALEVLAATGCGEVRGLVRHVVTENERVQETLRLLDAGEVPALGPVLDRGHASLRDDYRVSCPELDLAVDTATEAGALGARMMGAGFGGSVVVLVPQTAASDVAEAVRGAFSAAGHRSPRIFEAVPSEGARRIS